MKVAALDTVATYVFAPPCDGKNAPDDASWRGCSQKISTDDAFCWDKCSDGS
ncbi:hypothetical protein PR003_g17972 [Phytophthora rubi]|uniref:Uncharacterized protein n=1 Tax=Phytophthora rubi TaxID=129364 RepID=A0A6A3K8V4_9STRA|nr:hypothetical protein PR002_g17751 [Phytophthora rubi]KAE9010988.1 hypothetical protein PR001_g16025 [Phytophthora rubi]KAE9319422.1 hypothetical protein PR003_g17972 [Phytophthora rubi]